MSTSSEFKSMRKSRSLPYIVSRHESGVSNATASTTMSGHGSCSMLDQMDLESVRCNDHHRHRFDNNHARNTHRPYNINTGKYNKHNSNYFRHQQCDNVRKKFNFNYFCLTLLFYIAFSLGKKLFKCVFFLFVYALCAHQI